MDTTRLSTSNQAQTKQCSCCKEVKPLTDFQRRPGVGDGYFGECRVCKRQKRQGYYAMHPEIKERDLAKVREWQANNKGVCLRSCRDYYHRHPEKSKARHKSAKIRNAPPRCQLCDSKAELQKHHPDYKRPMHVYWLCDRCHKKVHKLQRFQQQRADKRKKMPKAERAVDLSATTDPVR